MIFYKFGVWASSAEGDSEGNMSQRSYCTMATNEHEALGEQRLYGAEAPDASHQVV
jgi:hypothetical protein